MPTVVDELVEVHVKELDGDKERKRQRLGRFRPLACVIPYIMCLWWIVFMRWDENEGCPYPPYIAKG